MSCHRYRESIADAAAGAAVPAELERHLGVCGSCRAELATLRRALGLGDAVLHDAVAEEPSPELRVRIREAVASEAAVVGRRGLVWLWSSAAAAAVLVLVAVVGWRAAWFARPRQMVAVESPEPTATSGALRESPQPPPAESRREGGSTPVAPARAHATSARDHVRIDAASRRGTPEVIVPPGQQDALRQLVAATARTGVVPPSLLAANGPPRPLAEPVPIEIAPLEIVPLEAAESAGL